jgi:twitching motility protein PilT
MDIALKAAETGHLVFSTLHTPDVSRTVGRVVSLGGETDMAEVRERLADNLKGVIAQRLVRASEGETRVLVAEALVVTGTARESIRQPEKNMPLKDVMEKGAHPYGMQTFEMHLRQLVSEGKLSLDLARQAMG